MKIIIGIGCHSEVVYSILQDKANIKFLSYPTKVDIKDMSQLVSQNYLGGIDEFINHNDHEYIIGIGDNKIRQKIADEYTSLNYINAIHPKSIIADNTTIGKGNVICAGAVIETGTIIGNHNIINTNASINHHNKIHDFCHIAPNCALCGNVELFDGVFVGTGSSIVPKIKIKPLSFIKAHSLIKESTNIIPMYEPYIDNYKKSAMDAIQSGWISSQGKYVTMANEKLKNILGAKYLFLVNNGTSATHCLFIALKYKYPNINKIYIPNNVYVAVWNCALMEYSKDQLEVMKINPQTWNMCTDDEYIMSLDTNSAVVVVHNVGNIINVCRLKKLRPDIIFVEDNCEGLFGKYENIYTGTSDATLCTSISFFANKTITTGEGGAVITSDKDLYEYLFKTCHQGMTKKRYVHDVFGYNYRITNIQAAFLYDQLCDYEKIINLKKTIFERYVKLLDPLIKNKKIHLQQSEQNTEKAQWMFALQIFNSTYEKVQSFLNNKGIDVRPMFYQISVHKHLEDIKQHDQEDKFDTECIMLPSYPTLKSEEQEYIVNCIRKYCD
jgi:perosamine synthetase